MGKAYDPKGNFSSGIAEQDEFARPMTSGQRAARFLRRHIGLLIAVTAAAVFAIILLNPRPDCYVLCVTSEFLPDAAFCRDMEEILSASACDINCNGAETADLTAIYAYRGGTPYMEEKQRERQLEKLQKLLDSGKKFLFLADEANALWLVEHGYADPEDNDILPGAPVGQTRLVLPEGDASELLHRESPYREQLDGFRLLLPVMPRREDYADEDEYLKYAKQYAAAYGTRLNLCDLSGGTVAVPVG